MTRAAGLLTLFVFACLASGCRFGMTAREYPPAQGPKGVIMRVTTAQGQLTGELIEVRDAGIVLAHQKLRLLPYTAILSSDIDRFGRGENPNSHYAIFKGTVPKPGVREHLRLLSRFPQGLTPELMGQLLAAYGQTELAGANP